MSLFGIKRGYKFSNKAGYIIHIFHDYNKAKKLEREAEREKCTVAKDVKMEPVQLELD
jgi:hypothetical protein